MNAGRSAVVAVLAGLFALTGTVETAAHGHPGAIDANDPAAWKYRLCDGMVDVAVQALHDRDKGRPPRIYPVGDGGKDEPGPRIANAIVRKVYDEPAISSPKRAGAFGRAYCNEQLQ